MNKLLDARKSWFFIDAAVGLLTDVPEHWRQFYNADWSPERMDAALKDWGEQATDPDGIAARKAILQALGLHEERRQTPREDT